MDIFSARMEQVREALGIKVTEFAERLGVAYRSYMNYKAGRTPPADLLTKTVDTFEVNPIWLMTGEGDMFEGDSESASDSDTAATNPPSPQANALDLSASSGPDLQTRMIKQLLDLQEENRALRERVAELELRYKKERQRSRRDFRG